MAIEELLSYAFWGNSVKEYIVATVIFVLIVIIFRIVKYQFVKKLRKVANNTKAEIDDLLIKIVDKIVWPFYVFFAIFISLKFIQVPDVVNILFTYTTPIVVVIIVVRSLQQFVDYGIQKLGKEKQEENETAVINIIGKILRGALWGIALVYVVSLFGYDVTTVVASFGVLGIVLAFGLQEVLSDIFASISIFFDKPFEIGDFIIVGDIIGVVKEVGIKSTRVQSLWGQEVVIPNKELTSARINNYKKMKRRRIQFSFGVVYEISAEKLEKVLEITKEIVANIELAELDRVHFKEYGDFSLNFEVVYYVNTSDYTKRFEKEAISFAYPTQTIIVNKEKP